MKKILPHSITVCLILFSSYAFSGGPDSNNSTSSFKSTDEEVSLDIERGRGEVLMHLLIRDMNQYHHIVIERSAETLNYFGKCKYISCADQQTKDGYMLQADRFPFSPAKDVYYRVKTVSNDGVERAYPPVLLAAAK
ncbi:MAG: hypothetical protein IPP77_07630 [Bacteroidetes bacterium]|nr:hypothetical protein [Bacteroidota bacterium]